MYILTDRWFFKVMSRAELEEQMNNIRMSAQDSTNLSDQAPNKVKAEQPKAIGEPTPLKLHCTPGFLTRLGVFNGLMQSQHF